MQNYFDSQNITFFALFIYGVVALSTYLILPKLLKALGRSPAHLTILKIAAGLFFISVLLPSPLINGKNTNFTTHVVGGGIFSGLIWLYLKRNFSFKAHWLLEIASLYFLVSGLGVANELMEFALDGVGLASIPAGDTWWDLFANTLGAGTFFLAYRIWLK